MEENKDEITSESSPEEQEVEETTDQTSEQTDDKQSDQEEQPQPTQKGDVPYERFTEVNERMKAAEDRASQVEQRYYTAVEKIQQGQQPTQAETDLIQKYGSQDPATREFLRELKGEMGKVANKVADERAEPLIRENEALRRTVAGMQEKMFRQENTDVERDSKDEREIAQMVQMGVPLDKATKAVMYDKRMEAAQAKQQVTTKGKTKVKAQANLERTSIPQSSGIPQNRQESFREKADRIFREAGR